jgi:membrane protease YdiL (CAAX protease family)
VIGMTRTVLVGWLPWIVYDAPAVPPPVVLTLFPALLVTVLLVAVPASLWPALVAYHAYCLGVAVASERPPARPLAAAGRPLAFITVITILAALGAEVVARGYVDVRPWLPGDWITVARRAMPWPVFAAYSLGVNPCVEEYFWRDALLPRTGIVGGAAAFGLMHAAAGLVLSGPGAALIGGAAAALAGLIWGVAARRYQSIWPCVVTHVAADAAILRVLWGYLPAS